MLNSKRVLLLIGSPKKSNSSSDSLGSYLINKLSVEGFATDKINILSYLKTESGIENFLKAVNSSDILILSFPLYVDSLPAGVIKAFELIAQHRKQRSLNKKQKMMVIANCGSPEALHNNVALDICKCFASHTGFIWTGSLALGGGSIVGGRPLKSLGGMAKNIIKALDITAIALSNNTSVPLEAKKLMEKPLMPSWLYTFIGDVAWKKQAKKFGANKDLYSKPYEI